MRMSAVWRNQGQPRGVRVVVNVGYPQYPLLGVSLAGDGHGPDQHDFDDARSLRGFNSEARRAVGETESLS